MRQGMGELEAQNTALEMEATLQLHFNNLSLYRCRFAIRYIYTSYVLALMAESANAELL